MAYRHVYVDPDATGTPENGTSWSNAYSTLNQAEQAEDNTGDIRATGGSNEIVVFHCRAASGTADTAAVSIAGWTTDSGGYIVVIADAVNTSYGGGSSETTGTGRHAGVWSTSKYQLTVENTNALQLAEDYVRVDGLQVAKTASDANAEAAVVISSQNASNDVRISNCVLIGDSNATYSQPVIYLNDADAILTVWNCVAYSLGGSASAASSALYVGAGLTANVYGCTLIGHFNGIRIPSGSTVTAKNCYVHGGTNIVSNAGTLNTTTCASSSTTLDVDNIAHDNTTFVDATHATATSRNYHLTSGSGLIGQGTTLSDDPPGSTELGMDIDGESRTVTWDIGADEWVVAGRTTKNTRAWPLGTEIGMGWRMPL